MDDAELGFGLVGNVGLYCDEGSVGCFLRDELGVVLGEGIFEGCDFRGVPGLYLGEGLIGFLDEG